MNSSFLRPFLVLVLMTCGCLAGCNSPDNPKMPDIPPSNIKADTSTPNSRGEGRQPYGASKKYQDMMKR